MNCLRLSFILFVVASTSRMVVFAASVAQQATPIADKIDPINPPQQQIEQLRQQQIQQMQQLPPNRSPFLDSLFNIPIQTLRAVNELVQGISGSVQNFMASRPRPLRSVLPSFSRRYDRPFYDDYY